MRESEVGWEGIEVNQNYYELVVLHAEAKVDGGPDFRTTVPSFLSNMPLIM